MFFSQYGPRGDTKLIKIDHCASNRLRARDDRCLLQAAIGGELKWQILCSNQYTSVQFAPVSGSQGGQERSGLGAGFISCCSDSLTKLHEAKPHFLHTEVVIIHRLTCLSLTKKGRTREVSA
jgi:hypothetical protein